MYPNCPDLMQLVPDAKELEGQTQCLQKEVAMNRKVIDEQSKELTEKGQQLITARLEKRKNQWLRASKYQDTFRRGKEM